ncbi:MAG: NADH-ubiquinone oxidoreductase-F iron-sulfur binding region domain-containing protein [Acidimicrobiia bacterium]
MRVLAAGGPGLSAYRESGGYQGLEQVRDKGAGWLREAISASGLRGRGGAAFPLATKWEAALSQPAPRYGVVNGAEDVPGSLKDRDLLAPRPHLVLDGALCSAVALEADRVVCYVNEEATQPLERTAAAIAELEGLAGDVELTLVAAPAAYVAGEDSCALEVIEGKEKPQPRAKPPYPAEHGIEGHPTAVSNVETLAHVALIARHGADWFKELGTRGYPGTLLVTLPSGCARPGVYEVSGGTPFAEVLELGGGPAAAPFRGAQVGGPAAGWLTAQDFDVPLDPEAMSVRGSMLGCAAVRLLPEDRCAVDAVAEVQRFFAAESCGKCPLCRGETQFFDRVLAGLRDNKGIKDAHLDKALELASAAATGTDCALARFPAAPLRTAREHFPEDFAAHLEGGDCGRTHLGSAMSISGWPPPWL